MGYIKGTKGSNVGWALTIISHLSHGKLADLLICKKLKLNSIVVIFKKIYNIGFNISFLKLIHVMNHGRFS